MKGFTLTELLTVVAILGILAVVGVPIYNGYVDSVDVTTVQNNLRSIYLRQQDYFATNNAYYFTGASCTDSAAIINTNLFSGTQVLTNDNGFTYCILQDTVSDFTATADESAGVRIFTIDEQNVTNF